jgi:transcriptional regulator with XRE-family HTH domain
MSQIDQFLTALKHALKSKNILYRDIAKALNLSESSIKRILSDKSLSLDRLEEICRVANLSFADIVQAANLEEVNQVVFLSEEQEKALAENARLLHLFMMLHEGKTPQKIEREYEIDNAELKKYLYQLDRLNLIELHPRDRVKFKRHGFLRFRRDGPVGRALFSQTKTSYLNYDFVQEDYIRFTHLRLSRATLAKYKSKLDKIVLEMQEDARFEAEHEVDASDLGVLFAARPWKYSFMNAIKQKE